MTPDVKTTYLDSAVLDTGDLLTSTPGGHHGARNLVAGQGQLQDGSLVSTTTTEKKLNI